MGSLSDVVGSILDSNPDISDAARDGDESAKNELAAKVMLEASIDADAAYATVDRALADGDLDMGIDTEGFAGHMETLQRRGDRSGDTAEAYIVSVRKFAEWYEEHRRDDVPPTRSDVLDWLDHLAHEEDLKGSSIQRHFHGIKAYFKWAGRGGALADMDVSDEYPDRGGGPPDYVEWDEIAALREAAVMAQCHNADCDREPWMLSKRFYEYSGPPRCPDCDTTNTAWLGTPYDAAIVQLFSGLGIRVGELVDLDVANLDLDEQAITVHRQKRTTEWRDRMYLLEDDVRTLEAYLEYRPKINESAAEESEALFITDRSPRAGTDFIRNRLDDVAVRAGVRTFEEDGERKTEVYPHLLRHSVGTKLAQNGYSEFQVKQYLGHARTGATERYMALDPEQTREMREDIG